MTDKLPLDSKARKEIPIWTFIAEYFPDVIIAMASLSYKANEKHNPGQPMHWSRNKSGDHKDCIVRHLFDDERIDPETGECEAVAAAWRACANAQIVIERLRARTADDVAPLPVPVNAFDPEFHTRSEAL